MGGWGAGSAMVSSEASTGSHPAPGRQFFGEWISAPSSRCRGSGSTRSIAVVPHHVVLELQLVQDVSAEDRPPAPLPPSERRRKRSRAASGSARPPRWIAAEGPAGRRGGSPATPTRE